MKHLQNLIHSTRLRRAHKQQRTSEDPKSNLINHHHHLVILLCVDMSGGYANRLKEYPHKGVCGLPENFDTTRVFRRKMDEFVKLWKASSRIIVLTGAGLSTGAGIPDFRGPQGIWTCETKKRRCNSSMEFGSAKPTLAHRALTFLMQKQEIQYLVTQNVDGLHKRAGLSRDNHCSLHGCVFTEKCRNPNCGAEFFGDKDVGGMSFQPTGNTCTECKDGVLCDTLLDWEDPLPEADFERSTELCEKADLVVALGTSLRIEPAGSLPTLAKSYVIVNLQVTPKDEDAALIIRTKVDQVLEELLVALGYTDWQKQPNPTIERLWKPQR